MPLCGSTRLSCKNVIKLLFESDRSSGGELSLSVRKHEAVVNITLAMMKDP